MATFNMTYEIVTTESAEHGDVDERGFIIKNASLRDALAELHNTRTNEVAGVECVEPSAYPGDLFRFISIHNGPEFRTGAQETRALHIPDSVTGATRARILRLVND